MAMTDSSQYVIRGGVEGRERLRILSRVMHDSSTSLFDRLGLRNGLRCLDVGCGGGDTTLELARRVGPGGSAVGFDIDQVKLDIARKESLQQGLGNVDFQACDVCTLDWESQFDVAYSRFLLTHLKAPGAAVAAIYRTLRPGGVFAVEDIDFSGHFIYPESRAFRRYHELYCATVSRRGGDPDIGLRLASLLKQAGFQEIGMHVVQPIAMQGEVKLLSPLTMENISDAVMADGLATRAEIDQVVRELYEFAADPNTVGGVPRVVQAWGRRPA
jgi:ubiquinone/menaquinone biosynthesis C-methylase UbiE